MREPFNAWSHAPAVLAAAVGLVVLVWKAEGALATTAYAVYGASLVLVFLASTLYHALPLDRQGVKTLQRVDHSAVFLVIAGSYTPICLLALPPGWGWSLFGVVWALTAVGIVTRTLVDEVPPWASVAVYLAMGWTAIVAVGPMLSVFSWTGLAWLLAGGLAYSVGAVVYATEWPDPLPGHVGAHGLWHLFVIAGSVFHYIFMVGYVPNV